MQPDSFVLPGLGPRSSRLASSILLQGITSVALPIQGRLRQGQSSLVISRESRGRPFDLCLGLCLLQSLGP